MHGTETCWQDDRRLPCMRAGDSFVLQLRAPSAAAKLATARKLAASASRLRAAQCRSAATAGSSTPAMLSMAQKEAEAVLRAWSEDGEAGAAAVSRRTDMGSLTGWQALAQQACTPAPTRTLLPMHALLIPVCACSQSSSARGAQQGEGQGHRCCLYRCWMSWRRMLLRQGRKAQPTSRAGEGRRRP